MSNITWTNEQRQLGELIAWEHNPRQIKQREAERLEESLIEFGQVQSICIEPDNTICDGHQRQAVWQMSDKFGPGYMVDVRVASRKLTEHERQKLTVYLHKGATGVWDFDLLADTFDLNDLLDWGFEDWELGLAAGEDAWDDAMGGLPTEDRAPFQQMTFTLHDSQAGEVKSAIAIAQQMGDFAESPNQNSNGNALALICETFVTEYG